MEAMVGGDRPSARGAALAQIVRFALSGGLSTGFYAVTVLSLIELTTIPSENASVVAYGLALVFSYVLQSRFTFRIRRDSTRSVLGFLAISAAGLVISYGVMRVADQVLGVPVVVAVAVVCVLIPIINFAVFKLHVFRE